MLQILDESIEAFLRAAVPLDPADIAVSFDTPDKQWAAAVSQPTVNVFLLDVQRDSQATRAGAETIDREDAQVRRRPLPRMLVRYILSAWTTSHRDEHQLLGEVMLAVLRTSTLEPPLLKAPLDLVQPYPSMKLGSTGTGRMTSDFWKGIDGQLKPALELLLTLPVDPGMGSVLAPPPDVVEVTTGDVRRPSRASARNRVAGNVADPGAVGRFVRTRRGVGRVEEGGRFVVPAEPGDEVVLELPEERVTVVPPDGPVEFD